MTFWRRGFKFFKYLLMFRKHKECGSLVDFLIVKKLRVLRGK